MFGWQADVTTWQTIQFPDLNDDLQADVCGRGSAGVVCFVSNGTQFVKAGPDPQGYWTGLFSNNDGWASSESYWRTIQFGDVDGNTGADVCGRLYNGIHCAISNGTAFVKYDLWWFSFLDDSGWGSDPSYWQTIQLIPTVDGTTRLCGRAGDGIYCAVSDGTAFD
jgi:hypothetical protein